MNTRHKLTTVLLLATLFSVNAAQANNGHHHKRDHGQKTAKVILVTPIYETVRIAHPEQHCWTERVRHPFAGHQRRSYTGPILGGIVGGALGNRVGQGRGKTVATIAGAVLGASIADDLGHRHHPRRGGNGGHRYATEQHCETRQNVEYQEQVVGYDVTYRYHGETYSTRTDEHPGKRIPIRVQVTPVRYY